MSAAEQRSDSTASTEPDGLVAISGSGGAPLPVVPDASSPPAENPASLSETFNNRARTKTHELTNQLWGVPWLDDHAFTHLVKYANPQNVKKTKNGFELGLLSGNSINWDAMPDGQGGRQEIIYKKLGMFNKSFTQDDAEAIIALAKLRGWNVLQVHGATEHKEKLWLAVQRRNLIDEEAFDLAQRNGTIPKTDKEGKPIEFVPTTIDKFEPMADSKIRGQWEAEEKIWKEKHPKKAIEAAVVPAAKIPPAVPEAKKPAAESKPAAKIPPAAPEAKKPAAESKPAAAKKPVRKKNPGPQLH